MKGKAYPYQSGYEVRAAALAADGTMRSGGNKEKGRSHAFIHGETSALDNLKNETDSPIETIAWYLEKTVEGPISRDFARPCGNCRDILLEYCGPELHLITANKKGIVYNEFKDFLFEDYKVVNRDLQGRSRFYVERGVAAARGGNDVYLPEEMKGKLYGAVLVSRTGEYWMGGHYTNVGYDSVTPVMNAVMNWVNNYPKGVVRENMLNLSKLVIVGFDKRPNVFYRDRQAILELDEVLRRFKGTSEPLPVEIATIGEEYWRSREIQEVCRTDTEEWLPHPFSPGAFRMDDVMDAQLQKLIGQ
jgi:cytidine deaminase